MTTLEQSILSILYRLNCTTILPLVIHKLRGNPIEWPFKQHSLGVQVAAAIFIVIVLNPSDITRNEEGVERFPIFHNDVNYPIASHFTFTQVLKECGVSLESFFTVSDTLKEIIASSSSFEPTIISTVIQPYHHVLQSIETMRGEYQITMSSYQKLLTSWETVLALIRRKALLIDERMLAMGIEMAWFIYLSFKERTTDNISMEYIDSAIIFVARYAYNLFQLFDSNDTAKKSIRNLKFNNDIEELVLDLMRKKILVVPETLLDTMDKVTIYRGIFHPLHLIDARLVLFLEYDFVFKTSSQDHSNRGPSDLSFDQSKIQFGYKSFNTVSENNTTNSEVITSTVSFKSDVATENENENEHATTENENEHATTENATTENENATTENENADDQEKQAANSSKHSVFFPVNLVTSSASESVPVSFKSNRNHSLQMFSIATVLIPDDYDNTTTEEMSSRSISLATSIFEEESHGKKIIKANELSTDNVNESNKEDNPESSPIAMDSTAAVDSSKSIEDIKRQIVVENRHVEKTEGSMSLFYSTVMDLREWMKPLGSDSVALSRFIENLATEAAKNGSGLSTRGTQDRSTLENHMSVLRRVGPRFETAFETLSLWITRRRKGAALTATADFIKKIKHLCEDLLKGLIQIKLYGINGDFRKSTIADIFLQEQLMFESFIVIIVLSMELLLKWISNTTATINLFKTDDILQHLPSPLGQSLLHVYTSILALTTIAKSNLSIPRILAEYWNSLRSGFVLGPLWRSSGGLPKIIENVRHISRRPIIFPGSMTISVPSYSTVPSSSSPTPVQNSDESNSAKRPRLSFDKTVPESTVIQYQDQNQNQYHHKPSEPIRTTNKNQSSQIQETQIQLLFHDVRSIVRRRIRLICAAGKNLEKSSESSMKLFRYVLDNHVDLCWNRDLDVIIMCSIYTAAKLQNPQILMTEVIDAYKSSVTDPTRHSFGGEQHSKIDDELCQQIISGISYGLGATVHISRFQVTIFAIRVESVLNQLQENTTSTTNTTTTTNTTATTIVAEKANSSS